VSEIAAPGVPGPLCVFGEHAFPIATAKLGDAVAPVVAGAQFGHGRVVAFGHGGYFGKAALATAGTGRLVLNAVAWAVHKDKHDPRIALHRAGDLRAFLQGAGYDARTVQGRNWQRELGDYELLCTDPARLSEDERRAIQTFIRGGGGLVVGGLGWGWLQLNPGKDIREHPLNQLLAPAGILWADGYLSKTSAAGYNVDPLPDQLTQASSALDFIVAHPDGATQKTRIAQAVRTLTTAVRTLPLDDALLLPRLAALESRGDGLVTPSEKQPVSNKRPLDRLLLTLQFERIKNLPAEQVEAHPAAEFFPGLPEAGAATVVRKVEIDTGIPGRHSTGLYAAAGSTVTVALLGNAAAGDLKLRIGAHSDKLWHKDRWPRVPEITRTFTLKSGTTKAANAFGGLVYVEVPNQARASRQVVTIRGAVAAPLYVLGTTTLDQWRTVERKAPGPWAELASSKIILTAPSSVVRKLDDPQALMRFWDAVADADADLAGRPHTRVRPERYVADVLISAGYMHAGYPIMTHLDAAAIMVDRERMLREGARACWGLFHELGHNHQNPDWTFAGTGEVTCNLFTLYALDSVVGVSPDEQERFTRGAIREEFAAHRRAGAPFATWKSKPFLALLMYVQLQRAFGWDAFKRVFAEYRALPKSERPADDAEKRDQWLMRFSRTVNRDLGPFFEAWRIPTSPAARASVADLPEWPSDQWQ